MGEEKLEWRLIEVYLVFICTVLRCLLFQHLTQAYIKLTEKQEKTPRGVTDIDGGPQGPPQCSVQEEYTPHVFNMKEHEERYVFKDNWI